MSWSWNGAVAAYEWNDSEQDASEQDFSESTEQTGASADYQWQYVSERLFFEHTGQTGASADYRWQYVSERHVLEDAGHIGASADHEWQEELDQHESELPDVTTDNDSARAYETDELRAALPEIDTTDVEQMAKQLLPTVWANIHSESSGSPDIKLNGDLEASQPRETHAQDWEPQTEKEYQEYLGDFLDDNLPSFSSRGLDDTTIRSVASKAAKRARTKTHISPEFTPGLAKLAFYDFIFLCDNSGSMNEEGRIPALRDTLGRVAKFATILSPQGISIRILNNNDVADEAWDNLRTVKDVERKMTKVRYRGPTRLGTVILWKIITPLIAKAQDGRLHRPVIVTIITDGEANNENKDSDLRSTIYYCNNKIKELMPKDKAAVVLAISRVGTNEAAREFVEGLAKDKYIGDAIYVSKDDVKSKSTAFIPSRNDIAYTEELIKFFLAALSVRTGDERAATGSKW